MEEQSFLEFVLLYHRNEALVLINYLIIWSGWGVGNSKGYELGW